MRFHKTILTTSIAAILMSGSVLAEDPESKPDDTWISLSGSVASAQSDQFMLDYGEGEITVEMDDWDSYGDAWPLEEGDEVTVYGEVDDALYEEDKIEASSVYVDGLDTFFYASAADEEEIGEWSLDTNAEFGDLTYIGTVETVSPVTDSFTIDTGAQELTVFTGRLLYDPLDDEGFQKIEPGDRVSVEGKVDSDFFGKSDLFADSIVTLSD
ncbi:MAG: NirD/YgiW/YdeI family stress tolerance protein [Xanthomonadales bacterium]|nr:NirD/YgiW/YdeI family stress tolerance protein [Xanthomonadales bacterium]